MRQWLVLTRLYRRPGASQTELADMLEIDRASAGRMIDRMEKNGWVERRPDDGDRRINRLHLTRGCPQGPRRHVGNRRSRRSTMRWRRCRTRERAQFTRARPPR